MPSALKKTLGIFCLLVVVFTFTAIKSPNFLSAYNLQNIIRWTSLFGIIAIGVTFPIITGGIDLSIGSVIGLIGCLLPSLLNERGWPLWAALTTVLALSALIGLAHGLLITKLHLQPFVVTLCGLLAYRSIARGVAHEATQGYGTGYLTFKHLVKDNLIQSITGRVPPFDLPNVSIFLIVIALLAAFFLNRTIWGRYLFALGRNEEAARFSGIRTDRMIAMTYVVCSTLAGVAGVLFSLDLNSVQPSGFGNFYELYAIAAAVLGGCSLRGGEGSILGVIVGTALMRMIYNAVNLLGWGTQYEFLVLAIVILSAVIVDEFVRRFGERRKQRVRDDATAAAPVLATPAPPVVQSSSSSAG